MIDIVHDIPACGRVAFRYDHSPSLGDPVDASHAVLLDGTVPTNGQRIVCGSCGREVPIGELRPTTWEE